MLVIMGIVMIVDTITILVLTKIKYDLEQSYIFEVKYNERLKCKLENEIKNNNDLQELYDELAEGKRKKANK